MMRLLALDLSSKTGWAYGDGSGPPTFGTLTLPAPAGVQRGRAADYFTRWFWKQIDRRPVDLVVFETPLMGGSGIAMNENTGRLLIGLAFLVESLAFARKVEFADVPVQTWRTKFFLDGQRPKNPKQATIDKCKQIGWDVGNDNEADACGLWCYAQALRNPKYRVEATMPLWASNKGVAAGDTIQ